jgi:hypothetical protein
MTFARSALVASLIGVIVTVGAAPRGLAQSPASSPWSTDVRPPGDAPALRGTRTEGLPAAPPQTTTIAPRTSSDARGGLITLTAHVTEEAPPLERGVLWRIFRDQPGPDGKHRLLSQSREPSPQLRLEPGDYWINAAYGRANVTRRLSLAPGRVSTERFVINAGGLKVTAGLSTGEGVPDNQVAFTIYSDERDSSGNRIPVMVGARPGVLIRLNAGAYQIQSLYGDANAVARGDVTVEPGKVTEATIAHTAARATLKLVAQAGGDALADTLWTVSGPQGETVKESAGALPTHVFAPGTYMFIARRGGQQWSREVELQAGDAVLIEIVASAP